MNDATIRLGILRCRDLVELYYGARLVTDTRESQYAGDINVFAQLIPADQRRIKYEIVMSNTDAALQTAILTSPRGADAGQGQQWNLGPNAIAEKDRSFLTDGDAVTAAVFVMISSFNLQVTVRETFLTPAPVD